MHFYLATASAWEAEQGSRLGFVRGAVLLRAEAKRKGQNYDLLIEQCAPYSYERLGVQADAFDCEGLAAEAEQVVGHTKGRAVLIMPMTLQSARAVSACLRVGAAPALQLIASPVQALVAARAGAAHVVLHAQQLGEAGIAVAPFVSEIRQLFASGHITAEIWVEAVRDVAEVSRIAVAGANGVLCSWDVLQTLAYHPLTDQGIERLLAEKGSFGNT